MNIFTFNFNIFRGSNNKLFKSLEKSQSLGNQLSKINKDAFLVYETLIL